MFHFKAAPTAAVEFLQSELTSAGAYIVTNQRTSNSTMTVALSNGRLMVYRTSAEQLPNNKAPSETKSSKLNTTFLFFAQTSLFY